MVQYINDLKHARKLKEGINIENKADIKNQKVFSRSSKKNIYIPCGELKNKNISK